MRRVKTTSNSIQFPLDTVFGSVANVRVLRVLIQNKDMGLNASTVAELAGISVQGAINTINKLVDFGLVDRETLNRATIYAINEGHWYYPPLEGIFNTEEESYHKLLQEIGEVLRQNQVIEAWLDIEKEEIMLTAVVRKEEQSPARKQIKESIADLCGRTGYVITVAVYTEQSTREPTDSSVVLVDDHGRAARKSKEKFSKNWVAEALDMIPSLQKRALTYVEEELEKDPGIARYDLERWRLLLSTYTKQQLQKVILSNSEDSERLMRSSPLIIILDEGEKRLLIERMSK